jgi:hypothetical protein
VAGMEIEMTKFVARRAGSDFNLFADGVRFGRLVDCEITHVFVSDDERTADYIAHRLEGDMSIREMLAEVRAGYEAMKADDAAEAAHDMACEGAWLRAAEYDPEALAEMDADDVRCGL